MHKTSLEHFKNNNQSKWLRVVFTRKEKIPNKLELDF